MGGLAYSAREVDTAAASPPNGGYRVDVGIVAGRVVEVCPALAGADRAARVELEVSPSRIEAIL